MTEPESQLMELVKLQHNALCKAYAQIIRKLKLIKAPADDYNVYYLRLMRQAIEHGNSQIELDLMDYKFAAEDFKSGDAPPTGGASRNVRLRGRD